MIKFNTTSFGTFSEFFDFKLETIQPQIPILRVYNPEQVIANFLCKEIDSK